ncbi:MAG: hypothetical protein IT547_04600 [Hyphomonadaceae bacterium]|nr:hypothetical protein [Hyphomonadaceae bacterium]
MTLGDCDRLVKGAARELAGAHVIVCLYTGATPSFCEPMPRDPVPNLQWLLNDLALEFSKAKAVNPTVEDGVLMFGRSTVGAAYQASGWSYRLFPPPTPVATLANKGSAFNSCLLMSHVAGVDALYQLGGGMAWRFQRGLASPL